MTEKQTILLTTWMSLKGTFVLPSDNCHPQNLKENLKTKDGKKTSN